MANPPDIFGLAAPRLPAHRGISQVALSATIHLAGLAMLLALVHVGGSARLQFAAATPARTDTALTRLVFLPAMTSGGGGGGGGNRQSGPIRHAEGRGHDRMTLRVAPPIAASNFVAAAAEPPAPALLLDTRPLLSGQFDQVGLPMGGVSYGTSTGPGEGGGVGEGIGTGIGSGQGPGLGPGSGGGAGGGIYRLGSGVTAPVDIFKATPNYTAEAMRARIQGSVLVECVVQPTGICTDIQVVRSLDPTFGLDDEAIKSVRQWRFKPGMRLGQPVPVLVTIEIAFALR